MTPYNMLIDGSLVPGLLGQTSEVHDPATGERIATAPEGTVEDARAALDAAHKARSVWRNTTPQRRAAACRELADRLMAHKDELAELECRDTGNTIGPMSQDVFVGAEVLRYFAGLALELKGMTVPASSQGLHFTVLEPFGVVVRITPFNHPLMFGASKIAAPLIAGNTVILKPPPQAPLSNLRMAELAQDIFPPGVLNIITGGVAVGEALVSDPRVGRIALTGSVETGKRIVAASAGHLPEVSLELGGKNPLIVFPDADVKASAVGAAKAMNFGWQGQSCGSASRVFVHRQIAEPFLEHLVAYVSSLRVGSPLDPETDIGAMISQQQLDRVERYIKLGLEEGARVLTGGGRSQDPVLADGLFMEPTVLVGVQQHMRVAREEIFGPVMSVLEWDDEDEMISQANDVDYGLTANLYTNDLQTVLRVLPQLEAGFVWVNGVGQHFLGLPYGGYKSSGVGREEGLDELLSYTQSKSVSLLGL